MGLTGIHTTKTALPAAPEMERGLLSILMQNPEGYFTISSRLSSKHFYRDDNRAVFAAISGLLEDQKTVDAITVLERMEQAGNTPQDAVMLLMDLQTENTRALHLSTYAEKVVENWQRRELMRRTLEVARAATDPTIPIADTMGELSGALDQVANINATATLREDLDDLMRLGKMLYENGDGLLGDPILDIPTIDKAMDGAHGGELCFVAGTPGEGKSALFSTAQKNCVALGLPFYDWSGEMDKRRRMARMVASMTGINSRAVFKGMYYDADKFPGAFEQVVVATDEIESAGAVFEDGPMTLSRAVTTITYLHRTQGIKIFFFDRKELFDLSGIDEKGDAAVAVFVNRLRTLCKDIGVQIFICAQIRKAAYEKLRQGQMAGQEDILGTSAVMQAATQIIIVNRPEIFNIAEDHEGHSWEGRARIGLIKNTNGELAETTVNFYKEISLFTTRSVKVNNGQQPTTQPATYGTATQMQAATNAQDNETIPF
jgi:replicative DNA helicase